MWFVCGSVKKNTIRVKLEPAGIAVKEVVVYDSVPDCPDAVPTAVLQRIGSAFTEEQLSASRDDAKNEQSFPRSKAPTTTTTTTITTTTTTTTMPSLRRQLIVLGYFSPRGTRLTTKSFVPNLVKSIRTSSTIICVAIGASTAKAVANVVEVLKETCIQHMRSSPVDIDVRICTANKPNASAMAQAVQQCLTTDSTT